MRNSCAGAILWRHTNRPQSRPIDGKRADSPCLFVFSPNLTGGETRRAERWSPLWWPPQPNQLPTPPGGAPPPRRPPQARRPPPPAAPAGDGPPVPPPPHHHPPKPPPHTS